MKKLWLLSIILLVLSACSKKEETKETPKTGIELVAIGPINFGGVLVGQFRDAAIRIYNHGPSDLNTADLATKMEAPFLVQSISSPCSSGNLPSGSSCVVAIRFQPTLAGAFEKDFAVGSSKIKATGRGLLGGVLSIDVQSWDVGTTIAGTETRKTFNLTNLGDFTIPAPIITLIDGVTVGLNTCGNFMATQVTCRVELIAKKTVAGTASANIVTFNSQDGGTTSVTIHNTVIPGEAAGSITFVSTPPTIVADGASEYHITTNPIKDQYGNIVTDNTNIRINGNNITLLTESPQKTIGGVVSFSFRSPSVKGFSTISLLSSEASGFIRAYATAGPPSGTIEVQSYTTEIVANGQAQTLFRIQQLRDAFGNVVEDGTQVFYFVEGGGHVSAPFNFTLLGTTQMAVTSGTVAGDATFKVRAGPIYGNEANPNEITGWSAQGDYPIKYIPGLPAGTIPMVASEPSIYSSEDQAMADLGIPIRSTINVGPVKDAFGNVVAPGSQLTLTLTNGKNITYQNQNVAQVTTDNNGYISFIIAGNGERGEITASIAGGAGASGVIKVWAFRNERITPNNTLQNQFTAYETFDSATAVPSLNKKWGKFGAQDYANLSFNDGAVFQTRYNNSAAIRANWIPNLEYLRYPCWFSRKNYVQLGICQKDMYSDRSSVGYDAINIIGTDTQPRGPAPVLTYSTRHYPGNRGSWEEQFLAPRQSSVAFVPNTNTYMIFGGLFYQDTLEDFCDRVTLATHGGSANSTCNGKLSCTWNNTTQLCNYKSDTTFIGHTSDFSSYFFDMGNVDQPTATSFAYGEMDFDQIGDYPPAAANMSMTNNGANTVYAFGGFSANGIDGDAYNQVYSFNGNTRKWSSIFPQPDPNERGTAGEPAPRYQNGLVYVPESKKLYMGGGLKKYYCEEQLTKGACNQQPACTWNDYEAINCDALLASGQNCYNSIGQSATKVGQFCEAVSNSRCRDIDIGVPPYNTPTSTLAANECNSRVSCSWDAVNLKCNLRSGAPNGTGEGWTDAKDFWVLDVGTLEDNDEDTNPTWKKLCDSQEPYLNNNPNTPNPAYRSCGFPAGSPGVPTVYQDFTKNKTNILPQNTSMIWNEIRQKMYITWNGRSELLSYDPSGDIFTTPASGGAAGLANSFQLIYNGHTGKTFAYKRGVVNQLNSSMSVWEADPNEKHYMRFSASVGTGAKLYAKTVKPIVRGAGQVTGTSPSQGLIVYIYNFSTSQWVTVGSNSNVNIDVNSLTNTQITQTYQDATAKAMISSDGKIELMITPVGNPAAGARHEMNIDSIAIEGQF